MQNQFQIQLEKIKTKRKLFFALIFALAAAFVWIFVSIFSTQGAAGVSPEMKKMAEPLNPTLNTDVLDRLESRRYFTQQDLQRFPVYAIIENEDTGAILIVDVVNNRTVSTRRPATRTLEEAEAEVEQQAQEEPETGLTEPAFEEESSQTATESTEAALPAAEE